MQGLADSKWAHEPATPSGPLCPSLSPAAAPNTTTQPLLVPLSNSPAFPSILISVPIQSPFLTRQSVSASHQQLCEPLFVLPKKTTVRISAPPPTTPPVTSSASVAVSPSAESSTITSSPPDSTLSEHPTEPAPPLPFESTSDSSVTVQFATKERISSADAFFGEVSSTDFEEQGKIFGGESAAKRDSDEESNQLFGPNQLATSLSELNPSLGDIEKLPPISEQTSMAKSSAGSSTFVNPYIAYVAAIDPDGTMDDGRAYVGGSAHYVDKPQTKSKPPASNNMRTAPLNSKPSSAAVQNQGSFKQSGPPAGSSGRHRPGRLERGFADSRWSGQALATAADMLPDGFFGTAKPAVTSSQRNPSRYEDSPRSEPPQTPKTWQPQSSGQTQSNEWGKWDEQPQSGSIPQSESRNPPPQTPKTWQTQSSGQTQSNEWGKWDEQPQSGSIPQSESRNPPPQPHRHVSRTQPEPRDSSQFDDYQRGASWDQPPPTSMASQENSADLYRAKQASETVLPSSHENEYNRTQTSMSRSQPIGQSFGSSRRGSMRSTGFLSQGYAYESDSESSSTFRSQLTSLSHDATQKRSVPSMSNVEPLEQTPPQNQGNPLFLQYPIGDGCHAIVAIYVEKDAQSALRRFPGIERTRLESSRRDKTLDEMAVIFKEALEDEKKSLIE